MRTWSLRILRKVLRLVLSTLHWLTVASLTTFKSRTALQAEKPRFATPTRRAPPLGEATETHISRSTAVGLVVRSLARWAGLVAHRQAGNRHWLAPQRLSVILDLESSSGPYCTSTGVQRDSATDSQDEPRESAPGFAAYPW